MFVTRTVRPARIAVLGINDNASPACIQPAIIPNRKPPIKSVHPTRFRCFMPLSSLEKVDTLPRDVARDVAGSDKPRLIIALLESAIRFGT
jgi:hypothetical protein